MKLENIGFTKSWEFNERHYGSLTGLNKSEMKYKLGEEKIKIYRRSWDIAPPELSEDSEFNPRNDIIYQGINVDAIPNTESLKDGTSAAIAGPEPLIPAALAPQTSKSLANLLPLPSPRAFDVALPFSVRATVSAPCSIAEIAFSIDSESNKENHKDELVIFRDIPRTKLTVINGTKK